jgi:hypothetical protein
MSNLLFVFFLGILFVLYLVWGFKTLPHENRQIMAVVPVRKNSEGMWEAINFTYYGLLCSNAISVSVVMGVILMGSIRIPLTVSLMILGIILLISVPSASIIAKIVEKKTATFTVGGGAFVGVLLAPLAIWAANETVGRALQVQTAYLPVMAALAIIYCFGEGLGRLACISFGCCYGKPLTHSHPILQRFFQRFHFTFTGKTKKIAYAHGWEGIAMVPIQAVTAVVYVTGGMVGLALFIHSAFVPAFLVSVLASFGWRAVSELFRSDYRGEGKISAYQKMSLTVIIVSFILTPFLPLYHSPAVSITSGLAALLEPSVLIMLQTVWFMCFAYLGKSKVTGSHVSVFVHSDRV